MIRMRRYPDGRTGLAATCDTCGQQITKNGYIVWNEDAHGVTEERVIHKGRCDDKRYSQSMPLDVELVYLANSAGIDLKAAVSNLLLLESI